MSGQQLRYRPIEQLRMSSSSEIVLWTSGSDVLVTRIAARSAAADYRRSGRFTHFLVLPPAVQQG